MNKTLISFNIPHKRRGKFLQDTIKSITVLNQLVKAHPRRTRRKLPEREREPLFVPAPQDQVWSADFMSDALCYGTRFRTFNVIGDHNREAMDIEIDTSLRAPRVVRVLERLKLQRGEPEALRVDNEHEFLSQVFVDWCRKNNVPIHYIQPGKPNQNAYIERFNLT